MKRGSELEGNRGIRRKRRGYERRPEKDEKEEKRE